MRPDRALPARLGRRVGRARTARGFTLVELVVVILIIGILGASVGLFIANPVQAYFQSINRAALADAADLVLRRVARELQAAVPNSARVVTSGGSTYLEFVPVVAAGRYRSAASNGNDPTGTDALDFSNVNDGSFQVLGPSLTVPSGSKLTIMNQGSGSLNLYAGSNVRSVTSIGSGLQSLQFTAGTAWPAGSPTHRFYLFTTAVTYVCTPGANGSGTLMRYYGYAVQSAQPATTATAPLSTASQSLVLDDVTSCAFTPATAQADLNALQLRLQLARAGESVTLYAQVSPPNAP